VSTCLRRVRTLPGVPPEPVNATGHRASRRSGGRLAGRSLATRPGPLYARSD